MPQDLRYYRQRRPLLEKGARQGMSQGMHPPRGSRPQVYAGQAGVSGNDMVEIGVCPEGLKGGVVTDKEMGRFCFRPAVLKTMDESSADIIKYGIAYPLL